MKMMTMRERMLAVLQGREHDRVPFAMYDTMFPPQQAFEHLGRGRIGIISYPRIFRVEHPHCRLESEFFMDGETKCQRNIIYTPKGKLEEVRVFEPAYDSSTARQHFVKTSQDYETLWCYLEDCVILDNYDQYYQVAAELGDDGLVMPTTEKTPWQHLWVVWVGLEDLSFHLVDCPAHVEHTIELLTYRLQQIFEVAYRSPALVINIPETLTAPAIGPARFRKYCVPLYNELAERLSERNIPLLIHMDGLLKPLWQDIANSLIGGIESFTPIPDGDITVAEAVSLWPDKLLWLNFPSSVHLQSPDHIRSATEEILEAAGHTGRLQIQVSENVPLDVWRTSFPVIADTIDRFGTP